jgi:hypothetical protein
MLEYGRKSTVCQDTNGFLYGGLGRPPIQEYAILMTAGD